jgi:isoleucyl-tRNA synthetase
MFYKKANKFISEDIKASGHLLMEKELKHSYPHDWRSKKPVIYRATDQWFIKVEEGDLREKALNVLKDVNFIPAIGRNRITSMIEGRPDWTISRQRIWGVPIPIFYNDDKEGEIIFHNDIMDRISGTLVEKDGTDVWFKHVSRRAYR